MPVGQEKILTALYGLTINNETKWSGRGGSRIVHYKMLQDQAQCTCKIAGDA